MGWRGDRAGEAGPDAPSLPSRPAPSSQRPPHPAPAWRRQGAGHTQVGLKREPASRFPKGKSRKTWGQQRFPHPTAVTEHLSCQAPVRCRPHGPVASQGSPPLVAEPTGKIPVTPPPQDACKGGPSPQGGSSAQSGSQWGRCLRVGGAVGAGSTGENLGPFA